MIILYIVLFILIILLMASVIPIKIYVCFQDKLDLKFNWLFFYFYPLKEKKDKKIEKSKEISNESENTTNEEIKKQKNTDIIKDFLDFLKLLQVYLKNYFEKLLKHLIIKNLSLRVEISDEDASKTAINYGKTCAVLYPILSFICSKVSVKKKSVFIFPNFFEETSKVDFKIEASIKPMFIIINIGTFLIQYIKMKINKAVR